MKNASSDFVVFGQINCHKSDLPNLDLYTIVTSHVREKIPMIVGITEPHVGRRISYLPDRCLIYQRTGADNARAALLSTADLNVQPMAQFTGRDIATGFWNTGHNDMKNVVITSVYMDSNNSETIPWPALFRKLVVYCYNKGLELIVMSDTNAHATIWGETETNKRGDAIESLMARYGLRSMNMGGMPENFTYYRENSKTIIDVTMCSSIVSQFVTNWEVTNEIRSSDHRYIRFLVHLREENPQFSRDLKNGDWDKFRSELEKTQFRAVTIWTRAIVDREAEFLVNGATAALNTSTEKKLVSVVLFFDYSSAFNKMNHNDIIRSAAKLGLRKITSKFCAVICPNGRQLLGGATRSQLSDRQKAAQVKGPC